VTRDELLAALRLPVVAAPMFLVSGTDLVVAAARAGVLGAFPTQNCRTAEQLDEWLATIAAGVGSRPWAVNLVTHSSNTRLADDLRLVGEYRPPVVITALGSPRPVMEVVKGYGGLVVGDVVSIALARKAVAAGVDGLACISAGAGGHTGHLSPFAFVSAVRAFFEGIITVGGGIADGHGIAGAVAAGADLVYMGTRFLASRESLASEAYKQMVVEHGPDDLVVSAGITGAPASWLRPSLLAHGLDPDHLVHEGARSYDAAQSPAARWSQLWAAGQGLQSIHAVQPVAEIVDELEAEYAAAAERFTRLTSCSAGRSRMQDASSRPGVGGAP
jgi:nitronate monooxygenase